MINAFAINDSRLLRIDDEPAELSSAIWLDLRGADRGRT